MKKKLSLDQKKSLTGILIVSPFILGFLLFFCIPFLRSIYYSFNELLLSPQGFRLNFIGLGNFRELLVVDDVFRREFGRTVVKTLMDVPLVLLFSLFAATLLNQRFKGRVLVRMIFFLPVIIGAEVLTRIQSSSYITESLSGQETMFSYSNIAQFIQQMKLPGGFIKTIIDVVNKVPEIIRASGIQILLFLASLQSIPSSMYEVAKIEGATGWETFWKVTFPLLRRMFLVIIVYTIIDSFTNPANPVIDLIDQYTWSRGYGLSMAMAWLYFIFIAVVLSVSVALSSREVYYES